MISVVRDSSWAPVGVVLWGFVAWVLAPRRERDVRGCCCCFWLESTGGEEEDVVVGVVAEAKVGVSAGESDSSWWWSFMVVS